MLFGLFNKYFCLIFFVYSSVFEFVHSSEIRKQTDSAFSNYFVNNFFRNMFLLVLSSSLFWRISHFLLTFSSLCVNFFFACEWFLPLSLSFCVAILLHTSSVLLVHAHHHLFVCSYSVLTLTVDFARPAGLTFFALSLSLYAYFCNLLVCLFCLRMSSRFQYEYTFKSCTCFLCYRPKRDDVFAHCFFF